MSKFIALRHVRLAAQHASGNGLFCARFQVEGNEKYVGKDCSRIIEISGKMVAR